MTLRTDKRFFRCRAKTPMIRYWYETTQLLGNNPNEDGKKEGESTF